MHAHQGLAAGRRRAVAHALFGRAGRPKTPFGGETRSVAGRIERSRAARGVGGTK